eukprot:gene10565-12290_t
MTSVGEQLPTTTTSAAADRKKALLQKKRDQKKRQKAKKLEAATTTQTPEEFENEFTVDENDPAFELYSKLLKHFDNPHGDDVKDEQVEEESIKKEDIQETKIETKKEDSDDEENGENEENGEKKVKKMSNRERKRQQKLNLPILKQLVDRPDIVELHDTNSPNPAFLIALKSTRNSVPVPTHWCQKRKYLQGKRGYVKPPFELPEFIAATGISKIREALLEKDAAAKAKSKQRDRMQPKMRRMDIDYQVLRDAFFIHQTKPKLSIQGELYYEGKEFEISLKKTRPGTLSDDLRRALGMPDGYPPPWLIHMQTHGPPPSYPNLKLPGVTAPIPEGAQYGFHAGGWGKPPADLAALFASNNSIPDALSVPIEREHWGKLQVDEEVEEEEEEEGDQEDGGEDDEQYQQQQQHMGDSEINEGISSVPSGLETPDTIDIKKSKFVGEDPSQPRQLYQVLEQSNTASTSSSSSSGKNKVEIFKSQKTAPVEITLNPSELEDMNGLDEDLLKKKYEQAVASEKGTPKSKEDYSDIIDEQTKKRKSNQSKDDKSKKYKF